MALLRRQIELSMRSTDKDLEWLDGYDDVFDKYIDYSHFQPSEIVFESTDTDEYDPFFAMSNSSPGRFSRDTSPIVELGAEDEKCRGRGGWALANSYLDQEEASFQQPGVKSPAPTPAHLPSTCKAEPALVRALSLVSAAIRIQPETTPSPSTISQSPSNFIRSKKSTTTGQNRSKSRSRSGVCKSPGKHTPGMTNSRHRSGFQENWAKRNEGQIEKLSFQRAGCQMPLSPPPTGGPRQEEYPDNFAFRYAGHDNLAHSQTTGFEGFSVPGSYAEHVNSLIALPHLQSPSGIGLFDPSYSLQASFTTTAFEKEPCKALSSPPLSHAVHSPWSGISPTSLHEADYSASTSYRRYEKAAGWPLSSDEPAAQPCLSYPSRSGLPGDHANLIPESLKINKYPRSFEMPVEIGSGAVRGPIVYPGQDLAQAPSEESDGGRKASLSASPCSPLRTRANHSRSRSAGHRRTKSSGSGHTRATSAGFVNFTPNDSQKILTGVAPSGSSKTKARREREAAERRRKLSEAALRAVMEVGGDIERLKEVGFDVGYV